MRNRADSNQNEIVKELRKAGVSVIVLSQVGRACPDILVGWKGKNYLFEIKAPDGDLSDGQKKFFDNWQGRAYIIRSFEEAMEILDD